MAKQVKALKLNDSVALESDMGSKLNQSAAAPEFETTGDYPAGYHVTHEGNLYRFTSDHSAGAWTGNDVVLEDMTTPDAMLDITSAGFLRVVAADGTIMWVQNTLSASRTEIAPDFSTSTAYSPLDLVVYNNVLYKCTADHAAGAWDASHFALATVEEVLEAIRTEIGRKADATLLDGYVAKEELPAAVRYSFAAATVSSGTTPTVTGLVDRAINTATLGSSVTAATITLPAATADRARDFYIDLTIEATDAPTLTFTDPATSTTATIAFGADLLADIAPGYNLVLWTELPNNRWLVSVRHEEAS